MRTTISSMILAFGLMGFIGVSVAQTPLSPAPGAPATNAVGGKLQFATNSYDFGLVKSGEAPKYSYSFTNAGEQVLEIRGVHACGCITLGDWTRRVEPGRTGVIPLTYNSAGFPSGPFAKAITVISSDKLQPTATLQLKGTIWREIDVTPQFANFTVPAGAPGGSTVVTITNNTHVPLFLSEPQVNNPGFSAQLRTNQPGRGYELVISRVPPLTPGVAQGQVALKTSWTNQPLLTVVAWANVQAAMVVMPPQLTLPPAPLPAAQSFTIAIQNLATNAVVLSEPAVTAKDVQVELKESRVGFSFNAILSFPKGFEIPSGQQAEFSVKSTQPQFPIIKVPIIQSLRPTTPMAVPHQPAAKL